MTTWALYPVVLGTILSMLGWLWFVVKNHNPKYPATLSEMAARNAENAKYFRTVLWVCGPLFGLAAVPVALALNSWFLAVIWLLAVVLEILVGVFVPSNQKAKTIHDIVSYGMAVCMWLVAITVALLLSELAWMTWLLIGSMTVCAILASAKRQQFIVYELGFLFSAHLAMVISAFAVL